GERGAPIGWLAIAAARSRDARLTEAVAVASARWRLSARQQQVLAAVVRGDPTTTIAANLGVSERAIELHITALFDRAGVASRAALVSLVLGGRG
ncbi:MAG: LuxR C-terminal-related transcriptional regulator, partial [Acidobacteriota bacterium]